MLICGFCNWAILVCFGFWVTGFGLLCMFIVLIGWLGFCLFISGGVACFLGLGFCLIDCGCLVVICLFALIMWVA